MPVQITAREGNVFENLLGETVTISSVADKLSNPSYQHLALRDLGIRVGNKILSLTFKETNPSKKTPETAIINVSLPQEPLFPLSITIVLEPHTEENINYFGHIIVNTPFNGKRFLPLTGRGTAALEGSRNDGDCGIVTDGPCASFQNRCAFVLAVAAACGAGNAALAHMAEELASLDKVLYGRRLVMDYLLYCVLTPFSDRVTYAEYLRQMLEKSQWTEMLQSVTQSKILPQYFYDAVLLQLSPSEFQEDREKTLRLSWRSKAPRRLFSAEDTVKALINKGTLQMNPGLIQWSVSDGGFHLRARLGDDFVSPMAKVVTIRNLLEDISKSGLQDRALEDLGMKIEGHIIKLTFMEKGCPFADPDGNRIERLKETTQMSNLDINFNRDLRLPLNIKADTTPFVQDGVNFAGRLTVNGSMIPFPGRGSVCVEPSKGVHQNVFDGKNASFLTRSALVLAICSAFGASAAQLDGIRDTLLLVDDRLYGKPGLIYYMRECVKYPSEDMPSFFSFISYMFYQSSWPKCLVQVMKEGSPSTEYFSEVVQHMTANELDDDRIFFSNQSGDSLQSREKAEDHDAYVTRAANLEFRDTHQACESKPEPVSDVDNLLLKLESDEQLDVLEEFGVFMDNEKFSVNFECLGSDLAESSVSVSFPYSGRPSHLKLAVSLASFVGSGASYRGKIVAENDVKQQRSFPLEVVDNDSSASTFLEKAAVYFAAGFSVGLNVSQLKQMHRALSYISESCFSCQSSLDYLFYCLSVAENERKSNVEFLKPAPSRTTPLPSRTGMLSPPTEDKEKPRAYGILTSPTDKSGTESRNDHQLGSHNVKIKARVGNNLVNFLGKSFSIFQFASKLQKKQSEALAMMGITIDYYSKTFNLIFREVGRPYAEPSGDRMKLGPEKVTDVSYSTRLANYPPEQLNLSLSFVPFEQDGVNFFGKVNFTTPKGEYRSIPLTGRGTIALEGRDYGDVHAEICTGGSSAAFQQKVSVCLAVLAACGASLHDLDDLARELKLVNDLYHGRDEIFFYSLQCAKKPARSVPSYLKFISCLYEYGERSSLLNNMIRFGHPTRRYYEQVLLKLTSEEILQDQVEFRNTSS